MFYLPLWTCTTYMEQPQRPEEAISSSRAGVVGRYEPPWGHWEPNPGLFEGSATSLNHESPLQSPSHVFLKHTSFYTLRLPRWTSIFFLKSFLRCHVAAFGQVPDFYACLHGIFPPSFPNLSCWDLHLAYLGGFSLDSDKIGFELLFESIVNLLLLLLSSSSSTLLLLLRLRSPRGDSNFHSLARRECHACQKIDEETVTCIVNGCLTMVSIPLAGSTEAGLATLGWRGELASPFTVGCCCWERECEW